MYLSFCAGSYHHHIQQNRASERKVHGHLYVSKLQDCSAFVVHFHHLCCTHTHISHVIAMKKVKHRLVEKMKDSTADSLGLSRAVLVNGRYTQITTTCAVSL